MRAVRKTMNSDGRYDHDLDLHLRVVQASLHRRAGGRLTGHDPGVPYRVHGGEIGDVAQPDHGRQDLRLVAAPLLQEGVDLGQRLLHLAGDVERGVLGDHAREIHAVAEHAGLAHARPGIDANDVSHAVGLRSMAMMWIGVWPTIGCMPRSRQRALRSAGSGPERSAAVRVSRLSRMPASNWRVMLSR